MIYLILTASLKNRIASSVSENRIERYKYAIHKTLNYVPEFVYPIIVENTHNNNEPSQLENCFNHNGKPIDIIYTDHGHLNMKNKGVNEWLDIEYIIKQYNMKDNDIIIKLTGRYCLLSNRFIKEIEKTNKEKDVWLRFMNASTGDDDPYDCILGCYAARVSSLRYLSWSWMNLFESPEKAMAKYIRSFVTTDRIMEIPYLDIECLFSENGRVLYV